MHTVTTKRYIRKQLSEMQADGAAAPACMPPRAPEPVRKTSTASSPARPTAQGLRALLDNFVLTDDNMPPNFERLPPSAHDGGDSDDEPSQMTRSLPTAAVYV